MVSAEEGSWGAMRSERGRQFMLFIFLCLLSFVSVVLRHSVVFDSLQPHILSSARLLCPWNSPSKNTRVGCRFLLQGIFLTQGSNPHLLCYLHWQADS